MQYDECEEFKRFRIPFLSIEKFPPNFETLQVIYQGFVPSVELHRDSLEDLFGRILKEKHWSCLLEALNQSDTQMRNDITQRLFYRSCVAFYRFYDLFLAYLVTSGFSFRTWSNVTAYYSRFYFVQAWLNLLQSSWIHLHKTPTGGIRDFFLVNSADQIRVISWKELQAMASPKGANFSGSHKIWWTLFNSTKSLESFDFIPDLDFVLSPFNFNTENRNRENYSFQYLEGFVELEWFDQHPEQMFAHFMPTPRMDRDFTDMGSYFAEYDPESVDVADFYTDDTQILWLSLIAYLQLLRALNISQDFITCEKLDKLLDIHIKDKFPIIASAISEKVRIALIG